MAGSAVPGLNASATTEMLGGTSKDAVAAQVDPHYDAVFAGDATGRKNVTAALRAFLQRHNGDHVALARNGTYKVTSVEFTARNIVVDFRGSRLKGALKGARGILRIQSSVGVVLNDARVYGTGYTWDPSHQQEHGIQIDGGSNITLNHPVVRVTRGDGIYIGYSKGYTKPPLGVVINRPNIERASRNGIAPVAGEVTIRGGHIAYTGLHSIDFEVNDDTGAASIRGIVDGVDIRHHGDLRGAQAYCTCYAVAAAGYSTATKPSIVVENLTGDRLRMTIRHTAHVTVRKNVSRVRTVANFPGSQSVSFTSNTRIHKR